MSWELELQYILRRLDQMIRDIDDINAMYRKEIADIKEFISKEKEKQNGNDIANACDSTDKQSEESVSVSSDGAHHCDGCVLVVCRGVSIPDNVAVAPSEQSDQ